MVLRLNSSSTASRKPCLRRQGREDHTVFPAQLARSVSTCRSMPMVMATHHMAIAATRHVFGATRTRSAGMVVVVARFCRLQHPLCCGPGISGLRPRMCHQRRPGHQRRRPGHLRHQRHQRHQRRQRRQLLRANAILHLARSLQPRREILHLPMFLFRPRRT